MFFNNVVVLNVVCTRTSSAACRADCQNGRFSLGKTFAYSFLLLALLVVPMALKGHHRRHVLLWHPLASGYSCGERGRVLQQEESKETRKLGEICILEVYFKKKKPKMNKQRPVFFLQTSITCKSGTRRNFAHTHVRLKAIARYKNIRPADSRTKIKTSKLWL